MENEDLYTKKGIIYKITNLINNKVYIGSSYLSFSQRYSGCNILNSVSNNHFKNSILKYGQNNFKIDILESGIEDQNRLNELEIKYILLYNSINPQYGYNKKLLNALNREIREKISLTLGGGLDNFLKKCKKIHGNKYDYKEVVYTRAKDEVKIFCKEHGFFFQEAYSHSVGSECSKCMKHSSAGFQKKIKIKSKNDYHNNLKPVGAFLLESDKEPLYIFPHVRVLDNYIHNDEQVFASGGLKSIYKKEKYLGFYWKYISHFDFLKFFIKLNYKFSTSDLIRIHTDFASFVKKAKWTPEDTAWAMNL